MLSFIVTAMHRLTRKTKIIATLGPSSYTEQNIVKLIDAGMDVARINLSHGTRESHLHFIDTVKRARTRANTFTAILLDTRGPEIRVGTLAAPVQLQEGEPVVFCCGEEMEGAIPVLYDNLHHDVRVGATILLDDGKLQVRVEHIEPCKIVTRVITGGMLSSNKRVSLPGMTVNLPSITDEDRRDILFGVAQDIDFIAVSFVRKAADIHAVRSLVHEAGGHQTIIAKIESRQGVENLQEIVREADGLMVARGDLGVELPAEEVPVLQKTIIREANKAGKPVITATQMLESMITSPTPTRAEASDVTNAIFDGTDAVMLSGETAVGRYPEEAVRFLARNARISEAALDYEAILVDGLRHRRPIIADAISYACCATAADLAASAIITATTSGSTALRVARYRPQTPILAISPEHASLRKMQLVRGVVPLSCARTDTMDDQITMVVQSARQAQLVADGDLVVITAGFPLHTSGTTNMLKVHTIGNEPQPAA